MVQTKLSERVTLVGGCKSSANGCVARQPIGGADQWGLNGRLFCDAPKLRETG